MARQQALEPARPEENCKRVFDERLDAWAKDVEVILGRELRHTIERVSPEAAEPALEPPAADGN